MRIIDQNVYTSLINSKNFSGGNTIVRAVNGTVVSVSLHGNEISRIDKKESRLFLSSCGYLTPTTKSRLNCVCKAFGIGEIRQLSGCWFIVKNENKTPFVDGMILDI